MKTTDKIVQISKHPTPKNKPTTTKRRKKPVAIEDKNQIKITAMFKPKVNTTSQVCNDVKTLHRVRTKAETDNSENKTSTESCNSSSTDVKTTAVAEPVRDCVSVSKDALNTAGKPCPDLENELSDFTSREQLSE